MASRGAGPPAIREIARRVERDVKSVHGDVQALLKAGVIDRTEEGQVVFPYDEIHVDFAVRAARGHDITRETRAASDRESR